MSKAVASVVVVALICGTILGAIFLLAHQESCPIGTTRLENRTCVTQAYADFINCLEHMKLTEAAYLAKNRVAGAKGDLKLEIEIGDDINAKYATLANEEQQRALTRCMGDFQERAKEQSEILPNSAQEVAAVRENPRAEKSAADEAADRAAAERAANERAANEAKAAADRAAAERAANERAAHESKAAADRTAAARLLAEEAKQKADEEAKQKADEEAKQKADEEAKQKAAAEKQKTDFEAANKATTDHERAVRLACLDACTSNGYPIYKWASSLNGITRCHCKSGDDYPEVDIDTP